MRCWDSMLTGALIGLVLTGCQFERAGLVRSPSGPPAAIIPAPAPSIQEARPPAPVPAARAGATQDAGGFANDAFPPPLPDTRNHRSSWWIQDCLRCHETGVAAAPMVRHATVPEVALRAKCRSCHVLIPGLEPQPRPAPADDGFLANAFPPMVPASDSHRDAWQKDTCLLCHESGVKGAPLVRHQDLPAVLLKAKCRSCHVQVRSAGLPAR